jgi:hypothetical protein
MKRRKIDESTALRAAHVLAQSREVRGAMRECAEAAIRQGGFDPQTVPEQEINAIMVHAVAGILQDKDDLAAEWIGDEQTERFMNEEAVKLRDPETGLIDENELVDAVVARQEELLHKQAPKAFPWARPRAKKTKKPKKRMKNKRSSSGPQMKMLKDLTIEDLEGMRGPEYLGEHADTMIRLIRECNPGVSEHKLRKMTVEQAFGEEED